MMNSTDLEYGFYYLRQNWHRFTPFGISNNSFPLEFTGHEYRNLIINYHKIVKNQLEYFLHDLRKNLQNDSKVAFINEIKIIEYQPKLEETPICSRAFFIKILENHQQNWAVIDCQKQEVKIIFVDDTSNIFDERSSQSAYNAVGELFRNGFKRFIDFYYNGMRYPFPPEGPYVKIRNRPVYSSNEYWS